MNGITVTRFQKTDKGTVYHCLVSGYPKTLTKRQLTQVIEAMLPEGPPAQQPANTLPDYEPVNGR